MLFVTDPAQLIQRVTYQGTSKGFGGFKTGEKLIRTVKHADDLVLLAKD
jgi:hypothetical protein